MSLLHTRRGQVSLALVALFAFGAGIAVADPFVAKPSVPKKPEQLVAPKDVTFARGIYAYTFAQKFWSNWEQYPGLSARRETTSGLHLSQARNTTDAGGQWQTWSASFFNKESITYAKANLFPAKTFKEKILDTKATVTFPPGSVVCKVLFTENVKPGMHTVQANIAKKQGGKASINMENQLLPDQMAVKTVGLLQMDISTKQYADWTWATFSFQPNAKIKLSTKGLPGTVGTLSPVTLGTTTVQCLFTQEFRGPADNVKSTCIACHQLVQYPSLNIADFTGANYKDHWAKHPDPWPALWPGEDTQRLGVRLDYMWEAAQALQQWDLDEEAGRKHSLAATPEKEPKTTPNAPGNNGGTTAGGGSTTNGTNGGATPANGTAPGNGTPPANTPGVTGALDHP